ncbi:SDR family oxidoreductase [Rhodobacterales bacterium FZCC0069]|nr:SDR family oxidoreductase [Rhodobacterales bacterium FZCC0069]
MKTAVVTGGTRGIGEGISRSLARAGWSIIAASSSPEELSAFVPQDNIKTEVLDVTDQKSIDKLFGSLSRLDGLVNCAGILRRGDEYDITTFAEVVDVNLIGTMRTCLAAYPLLKAVSGTIINTASMLSIFGGPLVPAYSASKGGVAQLTKSLAGNWAEDGIRVNAIAPGWIETEMTQGLRDDKTRAQAIMARTPMKRWGQPEEVGALATWLLSESASFVTGSIYPVDGGYLAI